MGDDRSAALPDGTDTVIAGASETSDGDISTVEDTTLVSDKNHRAVRMNAGSPTASATDASS